MQNFNQPTLKRDAQNNVAQGSYSDVTFRGQYTGTNLIYRGFARPGAAEGDNVWQLALLAYDGSNNITSITWPQATNGSASSEWNFNWTGRAGYTYS
jgi:hypothetical protein